MRQKCAHPETHITQLHITLEIAPTSRAGRVHLHFDKSELRQLEYFRSPFLVIPPGVINMNFKICLTFDCATGINLLECLHC